MLVLTRKKREGIVVSDGPVKDQKDKIVIRVIEIKGDRVKIGIEAGDNYVIVREELLLHEDENEQNE